MVETERTDERARHEKCPFCHDAFEATVESADTRVACSRCGAPHHAQCFVENRGCSVMGCGSPEVRVEGRADPLPVGVLEAEVASQRLDPRTGGGFPFVSLLFFLFVGGSITLQALFGGWFGVVGVIVALAVALVWLVLRVTPEMPVGRVNPDGEPLAEVENPYARHARGLLPADPFEGVRARMAAEAPTPEESLPPPTKLPAQCPLCKKELESEGAEGAVGFCYHCGAALG